MKECCADAQLVAFEAAAFRLCAGCRVNFPTTVESDGVVRHSNGVICTGEIVRVLATNQPALLAARERIEQAAMMENQAQVIRHIATFADCGCNICLKLKEAECRGAAGAIEAAAQHWLVEDENGSRCHCGIVFPSEIGDAVYQWGDHIRQTIAPSITEHATAKSELRGTSNDVVAGDETEFLRKLSVYAGHSDNCPRRRAFSAECDCGYSVLRREGIDRGYSKA